MKKWGKNGFEEGFENGVKIRAWEDPKNGSKFLLKKCSPERSFFSINYRAKDKLLLSPARWPHGCVTQWVWSSTHWCWERSTLSTGGAKLAPYGEGALRWRDCSPYAYGSRHNAELEDNHRLTIFWFSSFYDWLSVTWPPLTLAKRCIVSARPTWLNSGALSRDKDDFLRKSRISTIYVPLVL